MSLIVRKYGGSVLESPEKLRQHAQELARYIQAGHQCVVVVSALKGTTDQLTKLAYEVSSAPNRRELDMLISTGERVAMSLMSMALHDQQCSAISFTGSQAGILTNNSHSDAEIIGLKPHRVVEALKNNQVVVLAGFQGVHAESREITTLGRGGTDSTAVAIANALEAQHCEIIKDVNGLCSADPKIVDNVKPIPELSYELLYEMCHYGSKVLHLKAAMMAKLKSVPLRIGRIENIQQGTFVSDKITPFTENKILSINSHEYVYSFSIPAENAHSGLEKFKQHIEDHQLPKPILLASAFEDKALRLMVTSPHQELLLLAQSLKELAGTQLLQNDQCSVTATCNAAPEVELINQCSSLLEQNNIAFHKMITSPLSVTFYLSRKDRESCIRTLHNLV